jgi:hypothetical protein
LINGIKKFFGASEVNSPPVIISLTPSTQSITLPGAAGFHSASNSCPPTASTTVELTTSACDVDGDALIYSYTVTGGRIAGEGGKISWDLSSVGPGTYTASVEVDDGFRHKRRSLLTTYSTTVTVIHCADQIPDLVCPTLTMSCSDESVVAGALITFTANLRQGTPAVSPTYNWTVSAGTITSGQGATTITVDTSGLAGQTVTATVELGGVDPSCERTKSWSTPIAGLAPPEQIIGVVVDEGGNLIPGADVEIVGPNGAVSAFVDSNGNIVVRGSLAPGHYNMKISAPGFRPVSKPFDVGIGQLQNFSITLSSSVSASPTPVASPGSSPSPGPSPTVSASPSVTALPTSTNKIPERDQIKVRYPNRFLTNGEGVIAFEFARVPREVVPTATIVNDNREVIAPPPPNPDGTPGVPTNKQFGEPYAASATVQLIATGLTITSGPEKAEQSLEPAQVTWAWRLKPSDNNAEQASFYFHVDIVWRAQGFPGDHHFSYYWYDESDTPGKEKPFVSLIGPSALLVGISKGYPVPGLMGVVAMVRGRRRRRGSSGEAEQGEDEVRTTVFSPTQAAPGKSFFVQVFAHLPKDARLLKEIAQLTDNEAELVDTDLLEREIEQGATLTFFLTMPGLEIDEAQQTRVWNGKRIRVQFGVTVPKGSESREILAKIIVCENTMPIGHLGFKFKIVDSATEAAIVPADVGTVSAYKQAFISYAHEDKAEVLKRVQMLEVERKKYFRDQDLKSGEQWGTVLFQRIDESDVFFLFWSDAASKSEWVQKEIGYALKRQAGDREAPPHIYPVVIPPPVEPPDVLSYLQFGDRISSEIFAGDAIATSSRANKTSDRSE